MAVDYVTQSLQMAGAKHRKHRNCSTQDLADFKILRIIGQAKRNEDNKWVLWGGYLFFQKQRRVGEFGKSQHEAGALRGVKYPCYEKE